MAPRHQRSLSEAEEHFRPRHSSGRHVATRWSGGSTVHSQQCQRSIKVTLTRPLICSDAQTSQSLSPKQAAAPTLSQPSSSSRVALASTIHHPPPVSSCCPHRSGWRLALSSVPSFDWSESSESSTASAQCSCAHES